MSKHGDPVMIGAFVVGAIALLVVGILIFSGGKLFTYKERYVIYFEGSINGLSVGAPVKLKGVQIGTVKDILVQFDLKSKKVLTPVFIEIDPGMISRVGGAGSDDYDIDILVELGLRAQLTLTSLVTGQLYVEVDFRPDTPIHLVGGPSDSDTPEIPAVPSSAEQIQNNVSAVIGEIRELPIQDLFERLLSVVQKTEELIHSAELIDALNTLNHTLTTADALLIETRASIQPVVGKLGRLMTKAEGVLERIDQRIEPLSGDAAETLGAIRGVMGRAERTLALVESAVADNSPLSEELYQALAEITASARSVRILAETLQRNPDAVIYGKRPDGEMH